MLDADVVVEGLAHNVTTSNKGEYWRLLVPGKYRLYASAYGYETSPPVEVEVKPNETALQDFVLQRLQLKQGKRLVSMYDRARFLWN